MASPPRRLISAPGQVPRHESNMRTRVGVACDADLEAASRSHSDLARRAPELLRGRPKRPMVADGASLRAVHLGRPADARIFALRRVGAVEAVRERERRVAAEARCGAKDV